MNQKRCEDRPTGSLCVSKQALSTLVSFVEQNSLLVYEIYLFFDGFATLLKGLELYRKLVVDHLTESIHVAGRHYSSKDKLWNTLADTFHDVSIDITEKFTNLADNRLSFVAQTKVDTPNTYCTLV